MAASQISLKLSNTEGNTFTSQSQEAGSISVGGISGSPKRVLWSWPPGLQSSQAPGNWRTFQAHSWQLDNLCPSLAVLWRP